MWSPSNTGVITKLESVQRRFTKSLSGMSSFSYSERLRLLNLDSLEMRRLSADLMLCFKILKGFVDVEASEIFERVATDSVTRGHRYKLVHPTRGHRYKLVHPTRGQRYKLVHPTRGHRYKLVHPSFRINVRQHFFAVRICPVWNSLSLNVVEVESISCFKARLSDKMCKYMTVFYFIFSIAVITVVFMVF